MSEEILDDRNGCITQKNPLEINIIHSSLSFHFPVRNYNYYLYAMEIIKEIFQSVALLYGCIMSRVSWVVEILSWGIEISLILSKK